MRTIALVISFGTAVSLAADEPQHGAILADVLQRAGERVEQYFARAQSIVCTELVRLQPLSASWSSDGFGRTIESELRLIWTPAADGGAASEAQALRQVLRVNGHSPRPNDPNNCTSPEQETQEPQLLTLLLPSKRADYDFILAGEGRLDRRRAILVNYRLLREMSVEAHMVEGREDCISFSIEGGVRGRLWIDAETHVVLRLDQSLRGMVEIPLPKEAYRRPNTPRAWTMERWDVSVRYRPVTFGNPDETLILPKTMTTFMVTRGSGTPRLRTTTEYVRYQRFLTDGRIVGN